MVRVRAGRDESEDVLGEGDGQEAGERRSRDGREEEVAAGLEIENGS